MLVEHLVFGAASERRAADFLARSGAAVARTTGRMAVTRVPWPFDWTCRVPPNCRKRSRIPRSPDASVSRRPERGLLFRRNPFACIFDLNS